MANGKPVYAAAIKEADGTYILFCDRYGINIYETPELAKANEWLIDEKGKLKELEALNISNLLERGFIPKEKVHEERHRHIGH